MGVKAGRAVAGRCFSTGRAGMPTTVSPIGTSDSTALAPIRAPSPTIRPSTLRTSTNHVLPIVGCRLPWLRLVPPGRPLMVKVDIITSLAVSPITAHP